jgi:hypothetical protein
MAPTAVRVIKKEDYEANILKKYNVSHQTLSLSLHYIHASHKPQLIATLLRRY